MSQIQYFWVGEVGPKLLGGRRSLISREGVNSGADAPAVAMAVGPKRDYVTDKDD